MIEDFRNARPSKRPRGVSTTVKAPRREFDRRVLLTIRQLDDAAYGPEIAQALEQTAGKSVSRGALYTALDRLERKGLVRGRIEDATAERGGYPRRRFEVTQARPARAETRALNGGGVER